MFSHSTILEINELPFTCESGRRLVNHVNFPERTSEQPLTELVVRENRSFQGQTKNKS